MRLKNYLSEKSEQLTADDIEAIKEWIGVKQSKLNFQDFRTGDFKKSKLLQNIAKRKGDAILNRPHYKGMVLSDDQLNKNNINLSSISSFSRSRKIAEQWAEGSFKISKSFGLNLYKVIIEVKKLNHGFNVMPYAESLTGQEETLTSGSIKIIKRIENKNLVILKSIHT
jgi:hypothetical protein